MLVVTAQGRRRSGRRTQAIPFWARFSPWTWFVVFLAVSLAKTCLWALTVWGGVPLLGWLVGPKSGNDGDYYHAYAQGLVEQATSLWPVLLRQLFEWGLYTRQGVALGNLMLGVWLVPLVAAHVAVSGVQVQRRARKKLFWFAALLFALYPAPFWFTLDIYRDVFMLGTFVFGAYAVQRYFSSAGWAKAGWLFLFAALVALLFSLRGYLGFSLGLGFSLAHLLVRTNFRRGTVFVGLFLYTLALYGAHALGLLTPIAEYRGESGFEIGGSSFGLGIQGASGLEFFALFSLSFLYQIFGLHFHSFFAALLFLVESLPFLLFLAGVWINRLHLDTFSKFTLLFSLIYATIVVLGNDNLGTAMRLRMFVYVAVLMVWIRGQASWLAKESAHLFVKSTGSVQRPHEIGGAS